MNLSKQDVKDRKKQERLRDCRWLQIEESKLQQKLSHLAIEQKFKLRMLSVEEGKFKATIERKGIAGSHSLNSIFPRRHSSENMNSKQHSPSTSDSNDSRRGSQGDENSSSKESNRRTTIDVPLIKINFANSNDNISISPHTSNSPRPDTPVNAQNDVAPSSASNNERPTNNHVSQQLQQPSQAATRERSNTFGGVATRYKPNLPEVQE